MSETVRDAISQVIEAMKDYAPPERVEIKVADTSDLIKAFERNGTKLVADPNRTGQTLAGVPVLTDYRIPPGFAVLYVGGKATNVIDLRATPSEGTKT